MALFKCPECSNKVSSGANSCPNCGCIFKVPQTQSKGLAALLSIFIPGLGQIYLGNVFSGILWLIFTLIGYALFIIPGIILHFLCIVSTLL